MVSPFLQSKFSITREQSAQCIISLFEINQSLAVDNDYLSFLLTISSRGSFSMKTRLLYCICLLISNKCVISPSTELYAKCAKQILDIFSTEEFDIFEPALKSLCLIFTEFSSSISISDVLGDFDFSQFDTYLETEEARGDLVEALEGMLPEKENEDERLDLNSI
ncbi:hypothetical protein GPJ56_003342 [Histomonas meleagridis]|uniref:uncharacterized protein n=1 Tax=Histomonas meleagridis TaxID=135588 RepID=UPI00355961CD|nr:hypothetical protein GPJ56_003342 [Histomonas meleagridis]KAH0804961.1 hypothetical protein GO595_001906 [Histomonas meleagridis]